MHSKTLTTEVRHLTNENHFNHATCSKPLSAITVLI